MLEPKTPWQNVKRRFLRNKPAVAGLFFIVITIVIALGGYLFTSDKTTDCNEMCLEVSLKKPGSALIFLKLPVEKAEPTTFFHGFFMGKDPDYRLVPIKGYHLKGDSVMVEEYSAEPSANKHLISYSINLFKNANVAETNDELIKKNILNRTFYFGTDRYGRDLFSRIILGTRVTLSVGFISVIISLLVGITLGALAGFFRGWVDNLVMWLVNVIWSIPTLLLVVAISLALGKGFWQVFIAVGLTMWVDVARVVRGQFISVRETEYVEAARALGYNNFRIIFRHILPNIAAPIIVIAASNFAAAILLEAGLSFLGMGAQPPTPSWGVMIRENYGYIIMDKAFLAIIPGTAIMLMVLSFNLLGNGLRDAFDNKEGVKYV